MSNKQAGKAARQARQTEAAPSPRLGASVLTGGVADTGQQQIKQQSLPPENNETLLLPACLPAWLLLHLIDFRK